MQVRKSTSKTIRRLRIANEKLDEENQELKAILKMIMSAVKRKLMEK